MTKHHLFPFEYETQWIEGSGTHYVYYDVCFTDNFGGIDEDKGFDMVEIDYESGTIRTFFRGDEEPDHFVCGDDIAFRCVPKE